jgi:chromosome segregation ATPase
VQNTHTTSPVKKTIPAVIATIIMSVFIGMTILALGLNALLSKNVTVVKAAPAAGSQVDASQATIQDLQATITQYQQREVQYQSELKKAADEINQANQQNQQFRQLILALQNAGVIQITQDGRVRITGG